MKKILVIVLALVMVFAFAGCSGGTTDQPASDPAPAPSNDPAPAPAAEPEAGLEAEITIWSYLFSPGWEDMLDGVIADFNQVYPGVKISNEMLSWDGGPEKLQIALGTGSTPDIYMDGTARVAALPAQGVLVDITDIMAKYQDKYYSNFFEIGRLDGKNYLAPYAGMWAYQMTLNSTLAKELGTYDMLPADHKSWTWDEFYEFCKATTEAGKAQGVYSIGLFAGSQSSDAATYSAMMCNGAEILNGDHTKALANSAAGVEVIDFYGRLVKEGIAFPGAATMIDEDLEPLFYSSKMVISPDGAAAWYSAQVQALFDEGSIDAIPDLDVYMWPTPDGGKSGQRTASWGTSINLALFKNNEDAAKIEAAKAFTDFCLSREDVQQAICGASNVPTVFQGIEPVFENSNLARMLPNLQEFASFGDSGFGILEPYWIECRAFFYPEVQAVYAGQKTAQEALDSYVANVDAILAAQ